MDAERPGDPAGRAEYADGHLGDLVADLAGGSLGDADPALVLHHLADCEPCCADLADSVVAAAALRQLALSPLPVSNPGVGTDPGVEPPGSGADDGDPARRRGSSAAGCAADHRAGRRRRALLVSAVVAGLAVCAGGALALGRASTAAPSAGPPVASSTPAVPSPAPSGSAPAGRSDAAPTVVRLVPAGTAAAGPAGTAAAGVPGTVDVGTLVLGGEGATRRMALFTVGLADPGDGRVYEVWLGGPDPLAVGALDRAGSGSWVMPVTVAAGHREVLVVRQQPGAAVLAAGSVVATARLG